jgi:hypothetical protein
MADDLRAQAGLVGAAEDEPGVGAGLALHEVREPDPELRQRRELRRREYARREPDLVERAPEAIARSRVVLAQLRGAPSRRRPAHDEAQVVGRHVGEHVAHTGSSG